MTERRTALTTNRREGLRSVPSLSFACGYFVFLKLMPDGPGLRPSGPCVIGHEGIGYGEILGSLVTAQI